MDHEKSAYSDVKASRKGIIAEVNVTKPVDYHYMHLRIETAALGEVGRPASEILSHHMSNHIFALRHKGQSSEDIARRY